MSERGTPTGRSGLVLTALFASLALAGYAIYWLLKSMRM
jgi:hypothetical protein